MTDELRSNRSGPFLALGAVVVVVVIGLSLPAGRALVGRFFRSLRMQKVQAVNVDLSSFTDPNANPALHQMVAQMISDKVVVTLNETDRLSCAAFGRTEGSAETDRFRRTRSKSDGRPHALAIHFHRGRPSGIGC